MSGILGSRVVLLESLMFSSNGGMWRYDRKIGQWGSVVPIQLILGA